MFKPFLTKSLVSILMAGTLMACSVPGSQPALPGALPAAARQLGPGDMLGQMTLTTGSEEAVSLWAICHPKTNLNAASQTECQAPGRPLAIGPTAASLADVAGETPWAEMQWTLLLDDRPVDLDAFGTFNYRQSQKGPAGRDAYYLYPAWDVVVAQPTAGRHTLRAAVQGLGPAGGASQTQWVINFTVE